MACRTIKTEKGVAIVCGPRQKPRVCSVCGTKPSTRLCDFPAPGGGARTCDKPLCDHCTVRMGPERDYCPAHIRSE